MDSQWCLDACPTCATVVEGSSVYCAKCQPDAQPESDLRFGQGPTAYTLSASPDTRVTAWALDCYKSTRNARPASVPAPTVFPSPSGRKLHLRKTSPTSWISPEPELAHSPSTLSSPPLSTPTAVQSLRSNSVGSSPARSWMPAPPGPSTSRVSTKPHTYYPPPLCSELQRRPRAESYDPAGPPSSGVPGQRAFQQRTRSSSMLIPGALAQQKQQQQQYPARDTVPSRNRFPTRP